MFPFPAHLDPSVVSQLEDQIIEICNTCPNLDSLISAAQPFYDWACGLIHKDPVELRHRIETHEMDEHFSSAYLEEKDHLLKLPLVLLEYLNSQ